MTFHDLPSSDRLRSDLFGGRRSPHISPDEQRSEIHTAQKAMRDAQKSTLQMGQTAKKLGLTAQSERERAAHLEVLFETERQQWQALEKQLRETHSEALALAEHEKRLRAGADADAKRMEESGVLAAVQVRNLSRPPLPHSLLVPFGCAPLLTSLGRMPPSRGLLWPYLT